jgi:4-methoxybenzoate monooxygenase (O-demethylating)
LRNAVAIKVAAKPYSGILSMSATAPHLVSSIDPFSDEFFADLYAFHDQLREAGPVIWLEKYGVWGMARYAEVHAALNDWQTFMSGAGAGLHDLRRRKAWRPPSIVLEADPPLHDLTRGAMGRVLSGPAMRRLRGDFQAEAERLVEELVARGEFDAVKDLAIAYPLKVVGDAVGVPPEGRECLLPFSNMLFNSFGPENEVFRQSIVESERVVKALFAQCDRGSLTPDGLGMQFYQAADAGRIPAEYAPVLVRSILSAGFDTTVSGFSNAIYGFATNPEQWQILRENPPLLRSAFDEIIRWESPVQTFFRTTSKEVEIAGMRIGPDQKVLLFLAAANRDPRRWDRADELDVRRNAAGHVAFGSGIHVCIGQMLARLEAELLFAGFSRRVVTFELAGAPVRRANNTLRGFATLPVRVRRMH